MSAPTDLAQALREIIDADMQPVCCNRPKRHPDTGEAIGCCGSPEPEPGPCAQIAIAALAAHERAQPAMPRYTSDELNAIASRLDPSGATCDLVALAQARQALRYFARPAQPASVADGWREKFDELLEDYAGARAEVAVWNVTQSVQPPTGIRLPRSRLAKLRAHVDQIAAAPQPAKESE